MDLKMSASGTVGEGDPVPDVEIRGGGTKRGGGDQNAPHARNLGGAGGSGSSAEYGFTEEQQQRQRRPRRAQGRGRSKHIFF